MDELRGISKVLVANRGEIAIRVFRACVELGIQTVAIYSKEDKSSSHRFKADEAYLVGEGKKPIDAYLDIENILEIAKTSGADAIHPGYGFLSENIHFARRCEEEGITFIGPRSEQLNMFGDKVKARQQALLAEIPVIPGSDGPVQDLDEVKAFASQHDYPIIIKASLGGGGRGMRVVRDAAEVAEAYERAKSEAKAAFGSDEMYVEKLIENPKHIEVQILGDSAGNVIHLYERDCSIQRRHQKVIEVAPSVSLPESLRLAICDAAVQLMKNVSYLNAGTVEFLVADNQFYFIEVNPRVQVEHTITEMVTGVDIVQTQLLLAQGYSLTDERLGIPAQADIKTNGYAIQARVTTEDPLNNFMPDAGKIMAYRSSGGFGVRLDGGNAFQGAVISSYYDSLLVKVSSWAAGYQQAAYKLERNLREFRIRGIKTNIPFLENLVLHEKFLSADYTTSFIDETPELFDFPKSRDRGTKMLQYIGYTTVNGFDGSGKAEKPVFPPQRIPKLQKGLDYQNGTKQILDAHGPEGLADWLKNQEEVLLTDTTFRDAHQSLLATRVRTKDLLAIAEPTAKLLPNLFSVEMWGGATFDVAYRFLKEDPWHRLAKLREKMPNVLFQMLLRASNAVGYKNYPDNVVEKFVEESAQAGIDVYRIFDSLNWIENMKPAIEAVRKQNKVAEAALCYSGDILDPSRTKYDLAYYTKMAKELEGAGAHIIGIKDMAGLLKPQAAYELVRALKETVSLPIHLHTHDTSGNGVLTYMKAVEAGVDVVDVAAGPMAGLTSQPSASSFYHAMQAMDRKPSINVDHYDEIGHYWEDVRSRYSDFESGMKAPHAEVYLHEMPGGQYSNLLQQANAVGLGNRWDEVKVMYRRVNDLFGDVIKVTPSSKVVGDMALFMVQNDLDEKTVIEQGQSLDFPDSVIEFAQGYLGQPYGGFPKELQKVIVKNREVITTRPGELLPSVDFNALRKELEEKLEGEVTEQDVIAYALYPKVFETYAAFKEAYGDLSVLTTPTFFYGMKMDEEIEVEIESGKTLIVKLVAIGEAGPDAMRTMYFEFNGQPREILVRDEQVQATVKTTPKADKQNKKHIGATMPGTVIRALVEAGEQVQKGQQLLVTEAMKMETTVQAPYDGKVKGVYVKDGEPIQVGDLLVEFE